MIAPVLLVIGDGRREYLEQTLASAEENLKVDWHARVLVDDSGDHAYQGELFRRYNGSWRLVFHAARQGFAAAVHSGYHTALDEGASHVFHLEEDFVFNEPPDLEAMAALLEEHPRLAQVTLKRTPVNSDEVTAGGFMQRWPTDHWRQWDGFVEHVTNYTTNPSLMPRHIVSELDDLHHVGTLLTEPNITGFLLEEGYSFAYVGTFDDPPRVTHIGHRRSAEWRQ